MERLNFKVQENNEKHLKLRKLGYSKEYLNLMSNPNYHYVRFTYDELLWLESLKGKKLQTSRGIATITYVDPAVVGCAIYFNGGIMHVGKENEQIVHAVNGKTLKSLIK